MNTPAWVAAVEKARPRFEKQAALHGAVTWASEVAYIRQAIQASSDLKECTPISLCNAIELIGSIGITTSPIDKLAFLQARNVRISDKGVKPEVWEKHAELKIQYTGLIKLAVDAGAAAYVRGDVVYEHDNFIYNGPTSKPDFRVSNPFDVEARGKVVGAYAEALGMDGITYCEILPMNELQSIQAASKTAGSGPWVSFVNEMYKKAAIRRLYKTLPKRSSRIIAATELSGVNDGFDFSAPVIKLPERKAANVEFIDDNDMVNLRAVIEETGRDMDATLVYLVGRFGGTTELVAVPKKDLGALINQLRKPVEGSK